MEWTTKPASAAAASSPQPLLWDWDAPADEAPAATQEAKRARADGAAGGAEAARCQVEGCGVGLAAAKEYHRKHRVCEAHTKCPRVVVDGQERRFCQQCSRFHALSEFDQKKRSCRRRLSDHNARRRKPQPDAFSFASAGLASSLFDDERQISFMWNKDLLSHARPFTYSSWDSLSGFKLSQVKEKEEKSKKAATVNGQDHLAKSHLSNAFPTFCHDIHGLLSIKGTEASGTASILDGGPNIQRALSLLSAGYWGSSDPVQQQASSLIQFTDANQHRTPPPSASNGGNSTSAFCIDGQPLAPDSQVVHFTMDASSNTLQDVQRIKRVYGSML